MVSNSIVIKKWDKEAEGCSFLHGGLTWHKGKLYTSICHNKGAAAITTASEWW